MSPGPPKQFEREEVLLKALDLFWERGFEATSLADLQAAMGIGRQSLYDTFGDKRSLFLEALRTYMDAMIEPMVELLERPEPPLANIRDLFRAWQGRAAEGSCRGCFAGNASAEFGPRDEEVRALLERCFGRFHQALARNFEAARRTGELDPELDPDQLARTITGLGQGLAVLSRSQDGELYAQSAFATLGRLLGLPN